MLAHFSKMSRVEVPIKRKNRTFFVLEFFFFWIDTRLTRATRYRKRNEGKYSKFFLHPYLVLLSAMSTSSDKRNA